MTAEGSNITFTITNNTSTRETFFWWINKLEGTIQKYDFHEPQSGLFQDLYLRINPSINHAPYPPSVELNAGESTTITLTLNNDRLNETTDTFEILSRTDEYNSEISSIATFTIEDATAPTLSVSPSTLYPKVDTDEIQPTAPGGETTLDKDKDFPFAIYAPEADQGETWTASRINKIFYVSEKNALVQYHQSDFIDENNGQLIYASKDEKGEFKKRIEYEPIPELAGYTTHWGTLTHTFDSDNNLYSIHRDSNNDTTPSQHKIRLAKHNQEGKLLWTKTIDDTRWAGDLTYDHNGGLIFSKSDYNNTDIVYERWASIDGTADWTSQPYTSFTDSGGFGNSSRSIQILDNGSFLAASSGNLGFESGSYLAQLSLEDGSLKELIHVDSDASYTYNELFNKEDKIYFRTVSGSHEVNTTPKPLNKNFPRFQASDTTAPELTSVTFSGLTNNTVDVSQGAVTISTDVTFIETQSGLDDLEMDWTSPSGQSINIDENPLVGSTKSGTFTFSQFAEAGTWTLDISDLNDKAGNDNSYSSEQLAALGIQSSLTVINPNQDITAPELTSVTFSGLTNNTVDVSQGPVTISTDVTFIETQSGFDDLEMDWTSPSGQSINIDENPLVGNTKSGTFTFSQFAEAGTWTLDISEFHDSEGNGNSFSAKELAALGIQSSLTVINPNQDITAPELTSVTFSGLTNNTVDVSQGPVTISTDVTFIETQSGFDDLEMDWTSPSGQSINIDENPLVGNTKSGTFTFSQFAEAGTWTLDISEFHDSEGNGNSFSAKELAALGIQSSLTVVNSNNPPPSASPTTSPSPAPAPTPEPDPTPTPEPDAVPQDELSNFSSDDLTSLSLDLISAFTADQVNDLPAEATQGFTPTQMSALSSDAIAAFSNQQINQLPAETVTALSTTQLKALSPKAVKGFNAEQIEQLPKRSFKALETTQLVKLSGDAITGLTTGQLKTLSGEELSVFQPKKLKAIDPEEITGLKPRALNALNKRQVKAFSNEQLAGLSKKQIKRADGFIGLLSDQQRQALSFDPSRSNRLMDPSEANLNAAALANPDPLA